MSSLLGVAGRNLQTLDISLTTLIDIEEEAKNGKVIETRLLPTPG